MRTALLLASMVLVAPKPDVTNNNDFSFQMYDALRAQKGNVFFSPVSMRDALGTTYIGARGDTATEMQKALHLDKDPSKIGELQKDEAAELKSDAGGANLTISNRVWLDNNFKPKPGFPAGANIDFKNQPEPSRIAINDWVAKQTNDRIKDLLPGGSVSSSTKLVVTNAIYFKGDWQTPFEHEYTYDENFLVDGKTGAKVPMMHSLDSFKVSSVDGAKMLEMNYANSSLAMDVLLPDANDGISALEDKVVKGGIDTWTNSLVTSMISVSFPKVKMNWGGSIKAPLKKLGMNSAFSFGSADFSGIADGKELVVSDVIHKTFLAIDEKGTEAAAATGVIVAVTSVAPVPQVTFKADHPFMIVIRDVKSRRVVFMGRVTNPNT